MLFATTGMRRGEVAGLRLGDLDLDNGWVTPRRPRIVVDQQVHRSDPKTAAGRRGLALDPTTVAALRDHLARRADEQRVLGSRWQDGDLVFTWPDGREIHPKRLYDWFLEHSRNAGLPRITLHDLRHSYATAALRAGVPVKIVSERLGHANTSITQDLYSHVTPGMDKQAADQIARLILSDPEVDDGQKTETSVDKWLTTEASDEESERR